MFNRIIAFIKRFKKETESYETIMASFMSTIEALVDFSDRMKDEAAVAKAEAEALVEKHNECLSESDKAERTMSKLARLVE